jgi:rhamnose transport system substrate-binding protein
MNVRGSAGLAVAAAVALIVSACSGAASPSPTTAAASSAPAASAAPASGAASAVAGGGSANVVFIPKQINNPYFDVAAKGGQKAATDLGGKFSQVGPTTSNAADQVPFIQTATTQGVSAIVISADDKDAIAPALKAAMAAGIKVVGYDSSPAVGAYNVFVNQADTAGIGKGLADMACDIAASCTGEIAVLSAAATATNQNAWIDAMKTTLKDAKYAGLKLDDVVYGNDDPTESTKQAQALLQKYPNLKVIIAPTTVGIVAAAQVVESTSGSKVKVTGLGTPKGMQAYVKSGTSPEFALWNVTDLGYLAYYVAAKLVSGDIKGTSGETFTVASLNGGKPYTIGQDNVVVLGPPFVFNKDNIDKYVTEFGF